MNAPNFTRGDVRGNVVPMRQRTAARHDGNLASQRNATNDAARTPVQYG